MLDWKIGDCWLIPAYNFVFVDRLTISTPGGSFGTISINDNGTATSHEEGKKDWEVIVRVLRANDGEFMTITETILGWYKEDIPDYPPKLIGNIFEDQNLAVEFALAGIKHKGRPLNEGVDEIAKDLQDWVDSVR